jgi:L-amino acid N-acyltransferase YncA
MSGVRLALPADLPSIVAIYNQAITAGNATADTHPFNVNQRMDWFREHDPDTHPIYVYESNGGQILGWLSVSPYRGRPALARTGEVSYYVDYSQHHRGIGSELMQHAIQDAPRTGRKIFIAILLEWNIASIKLLEKYGYRRWGRMPEVAEYNSCLCAHLYYGRRV